MDHSIRGIDHTFSAKPTRLTGIANRRSISADNLPKIARLQTNKESLLVTKIITCTKEIFKQATEFKTIIGKIEDGKISQELYDASKILIETINSLLTASNVFTFQVSEQSPQTKKESKNLENINMMQNACQSIINLCYEPSSLENSHKFYRTSWQQKEIGSLKEQLKIVILNMNKLLSETSFSPIKLRETAILKRFTHRMEKKIYGHQLNCIFKNDKHTEQWEKVKHKVSSYFNKYILIDLQAEISSQTSILLNHNEPIESPMSVLIAQRLFLIQKKNKGIGEEKVIQTGLERNHIHILGIYQTRLLNLANSLKRPNDAFLSSDHRGHIAELKKIFIESPKYIEDLDMIFLSAISDSLTINYIEGLLETYNVAKIATMLARLKEEGMQKNSWDYTSIEETHWDRLLKLTNISMEEMERALMGGQIWMINQNRDILLNPPERISSDDSKKVKKINDYLRSTEQLLSKHIGDLSGTLLTKFREIGYEMIQQNFQEGSVQTTQIGEEESILNIDHQIFTIFAPVMKKMGENIALTSEEEGMFINVENMLKDSYSEIISQYGIKKIAKLLFSLHRILNQSFMIGTLSMLKAGLAHIYPNDKQGIKSFSDENVSSASLFVELGEDEKIALEWVYTNQLYSEKWLFTQVLRIELPPIDSDGQRGKVTQEFKFRPRDPKDEIDIEQKLEVLQRISDIRRVLKAMKFPDGSFNQEVIPDSEFL